jgi:hypothetical protein
VIALASISAAIKTPTFEQVAIPAALLMFFVLNRGTEAHTVTSA